MDASGAARQMVDGCGLTQRQIEARAGRYTGWVAQSLGRPKIGADLLASMAGACGYRLDLVPLDGGDPITIGRGDDGDGDQGATIDQARALIARGLAMLDRAGGAAG